MRCSTYAYKRTEHKKNDVTFKFNCGALPNSRLWNVYSAKTMLQTPSDGFQVRLIELAIPA